MKLRQLKDVVAFEGWIKKILIHKCYRDLRQNRVWGNFDELPHKTDDWWDDELNRKMDLLSNQSRLYTVLSLLPEALRTTMLLRYFSQFQSYEVIASILSIPVGTVRSRLNQAKLKLLEYWQQHKEAGINIFKECEEWNDFYYAVYSGMHSHDDLKNRLINHLQKDIQIIFPGGNLNIGRRIYEGMIVDDRKFGSWLTPINVLSCGNISIVEIKHNNSSEHPHHCPPKSVSVLYRKSREVNKMNLYVSSVPMT